MKIRKLVLLLLPIAICNNRCYTQELRDSALTQASQINAKNKPPANTLQLQTPTAGTEEITGFKLKKQKLTRILQSAKEGATEINNLDNYLSSVTTLPEKFLGKIDQKIRRFSNTLTQSTEKYLARLIKNEKRLQKKLLKTDSLAAKELFAHSIDSLQKLKQQIISGTAITSVIDIPKDYNAYLDSLGGSLSFLKGAGQYLQKGKAAAKKLNIGNNELDQLKNKLATTDAIRQYIKERRETLTSYFTNTKSTLLGGKELQQLSKNCYYYQQQVNEWKDAFSNPEKLESKAMGVLRNLPLFKQFMQQHSELAGLLNIPEGYGQTTAGMQTRDDIMKQISQRFGGGAGVQQMINGQLGAAKDQLQKLKDKFPNLDGTADMPNFTPKPLKTKTFFQRIEYASNLGFSPHTTLLPTAADMGIQAGYKLSKNGIAGIGASFKAGFGRDIQHIHFSNQGYGIRSFLDWNLSKANLHVNGGFEYNYFTGLNNSVEQAANTFSKNGPWQSSALLGISKKFKIGKQANKQVILLYDFLHAKHYPATEAIKFRVAYSF